MKASEQKRLPLQPPKPEVPKTDLDVAVTNALWTRNLTNYNRDPEAVKRQKSWDREYREGK